MFEVNWTLKAHRTNVLEKNEKTGQIWAKMKI